MAPGSTGSLGAGARAPSPDAGAQLSLRSASPCPRSREPSPDNEGALHASFHQLIQEQSSLVEAGLELEMQARGRGKAPRPGGMGTEYAQGHPLSPTLLLPARAPVEVARALVGAL